MHKAEVDAAIAAAREALDAEATAWIRDSALQERAFWIGLLSGLSAVADDEWLSPIAMAIARDTMFRRAGDRATDEEAFTDSAVGKALRELAEASHRLLETGNPDGVAEARRRLGAFLEGYDRHWRAVLDDVHSLLQRHAELTDDVASAKRRLDESEPSRDSDLGEFQRRVHQMERSVESYYHESSELLSSVERALRSLPCLKHES